MVTCEDAVLENVNINSLKKSIHSPFRKVALLDTSGYRA